MPSSPGAAVAVAPVAIVGSACRAPMPMLWQLQGCLRRRARPSQLEGCLRRHMGGGNRGAAGGLSKWCPLVPMQINPALYQCYTSAGNPKLCVSSWGENDMGTFVDKNWWTQGLSTSKHPHQELLPFLLFWKCGFATKCLPRQHLVLASA